jgi:hypothetical protein
MNAAKPRVPRERLARGLSRALAWSQQGPGAAVVLIGGFLVVGLIFVVGSMIAWRRWGGLVARDPRFTITADNLELPEQPAWIRANVKEEVMRDGNLAAVNLLDPQATMRVARACEVHTWVADVRRVRKQYPSRLVVELEYRKPVAMVEVKMGEERGLLPIDGRGVLLPPQDFTSEQCRDFLRLAAGETYPAGPAGTAWGDERVIGAAQIASLLADQWRELGLHRVVAVAKNDPQRRRFADPTYELTTRSPTLVIWGHAPGKELNTEASAAEKIVRLEQLIAKHGQLPTEGAGLEIDLRDRAGITMRPRTVTPASYPRASLPIPEETPAAAPQ